MKTIDGPGVSIEAVPEDTRNRKIEQLIQAARKAFKTGLTEEQAEFVQSVIEKSDYEKAFLLLANFGNERWAQVLMERMAINDTLTASRTIWLHINEEWASSLIQKWANSDNEMLAEEALRSIAYAQDQPWSEEVYRREASKDPSIIGWNSALLVRKEWGKKLLEETSQKHPEAIFVNTPSFDDGAYSPLNKSQERMRQSLFIQSAILMAKESPERVIYRLSDFRFRGMPFETILKIAQLAFSELNAEDPEKARSLLAQCKERVAEHIKLS